MLSYRLLSVVPSLILSVITAGVILDRSDEPSAETLMASRYHQRQHSSMVSGRFGFRNSRTSPANSLQRQHMDRPSPVGPHYLRPQEKIATRPATGVRS